MRDPDACDIRATHFPSICVELAAQHHRVVGLGVFPFNAQVSVVGSFSLANTTHARRSRASSAPVDLDHAIQDLRALRQNLGTALATPKGQKGRELVKKVEAALRAGHLTIIFYLANSATISDGTLTKVRARIKKIIYRVPQIALQNEARRNQESDRKR